MEVSELEALGLDSNNLLPKLFDDGVGCKKASNIDAFTGVYYMAVSRAVRKFEVDSWE